MKKEYLTVANCITSLRIVGALIIVFLKPLKTFFFIVYTLSGVTDAIDGFIARMLHQESEFGSKLDSVADLTFYSVLMIKILPLLIKLLPCSIWHFIVFAILVRIILYLYTAFKNKKLLSSHSYLNKATGLLIFFLPYVLLANFVELYCWILVGIAVAATIQEFINVIIKKM